MLIDWFTVGAQALNFLVLVWLMRRFLYNPILHAIDEREKRIAAELADAKTKETEAKKEREIFQNKNEEFDTQRSALLGKAIDDAKAEGQRLLDEGRKAADALSAKRMESLKSEVHDMNQAIELQMRQEVFAMTRKALADLATVSLDGQMVDAFIQRLRDKDGKSKATLVEAMKAEKESTVVRSAFDLTDGQRDEMTKALNEIFPAEMHVRYETVPSLIGGIELSSNGHKLAWSITGYITSLEQGVNDLLNKSAKLQTKSAQTKNGSTPESVSK